MLLGLVVAGAHQGADEGRRAAEDGDLVVGDHPPHAVRPGCVRRALVEDHGGALAEAAEDQPGTHHPADVGDPQDGVVPAQVEAPGHVLRDLDGEAGVDVNGALGLAGRPRGVDDHDRVVGVAAMGRQLLRLASQGELPDLVPAEGPGDFSDDASEHDDVLDGRAAEQRLVRDLLHLHHLAAAIEAVRAEQDLGLGVIEPRRDRAGPEAAEERHDDRSQLGDREQRDRRLGDHGQEDADRVPGLDAQLLQRPGQPADLAVQLGVGQPADLARLALPDQGHLVGLGVGAADPAVQAGLDDVDLPVDEPARPLGPSGLVEDLVVVAVEGDAEVVDDRIPEPLRILDRTLLQRLQAADAVPSHERRQPGPLDHLGGRRPDDVPDHDGLHRVQV